jgi:hypothetical protein
MGRKKNSEPTAPATPTAELPPLKIGSRVRCTDDQVEGRITWANGVSVKIQWDDSEQVTWRRDSLAGRPVEILDADDGSEPRPPAEPAAAEEAAPAEPPAAGPGTTAATAEAQALEEHLQGNAVAEGNEASGDYDRRQDHGNDDGSARHTEAATELVPPSDAPAEQTDAGTATEPLQPSPKPKRQRKAPAEAKEKKLSALAAAARVLAEEGRPMTCKEMIGAMAAKGYWTSPAGKTPDATLYSAILRQLAKGEQSRFTKTDRGNFGLRG